MRTVALTTVACALLFTAGWYGMSRAAGEALSEAGRPAGTGMTATGNGGAATPASLSAAPAHVTRKEGTPPGERGTERRSTHYWQQRARKLQRQNRKLRRALKRDSQYAIRLASRAFGIPEHQMRRVARCESRFDPTAKNPRSTASGLYQFLSSTWASTPFSVAFSVWDPVANALAAAQIVRADGGWRQWECRP